MLRTDDQDTPQHDEPSRRQKRLIRASAIGVIMLSALIGGLSVVSIYEWSIGGIPRLSRFLSGELQRERLAHGVDNYFPEGFVLVLGFTMGALVGLLAWRRAICRLTTLTKQQIDDLFR